MPVKPHPTDPDKVIYQSRHYDFPLQGATTLKREWVGLTDEEIEHAYMHTANFVDMARVLEDILQEKNNG